MEKLAKAAPVMFARISNMSGLLVVVNSCCAISINTPKKTESMNEKNNGLYMFLFLTWVLKNSTHSEVNTKWKNACTALSRLGISIVGMLLDFVKHKYKITADQATAEIRKNNLRTN